MWEAKRKYARGECVTVYLKPIEVIESMGGKIKRGLADKIINIQHSSGSGGGLSIRPHFIKFFSDDIPIKVRFDDYASGRNIFKDGSQLFYEEWFYDESEIQNNILPNDLFEI